MSAAWIVEWVLHRQDSPIHDLRPFILPWRWHENKVLDFMRCLYWNSPISSPFDTMTHVNNPEPKAIRILRQGDRLIYGDATHLVAWFVRDLQMQRDAEGKVVIEWTAQPGKKFDSKTNSVQPLGVLLAKQYVWDSQHDAPV